MHLKKQLLPFAFLFALILGTGCKGCQGECIVDSGTIIECESSPGMGFDYETCECREL